MTRCTLFILSLAGSAVIFAASPTAGIRLNQAGYPPGAPKVAAVVSASAADEFTVRNANSGAVVFTGKLEAATLDPDSGDPVRLADFSKLATSGRYYLDVAGVGRSWEFSIGRDVYDRAFYLAMRSFYGQRCNTAVDLGPEFPGYKYEACHLDEAYHPSSGRSGRKKPSGGWHDAGDYGRYIVNSGISTGTLLWTWEMFGDRFRKLSLNIPESKNRTPDFLDEIRWNLEWVLSMQDADGGVWHKQTTEKFCGFVMPEKDAMVSYVIGSGAEPWKTSCSTADFAAVMAIAARVYKPWDGAFAERCDKAARSAWQWLEKYPAALYRNPQGITTGAYGDRDCGDEHLWAAAELWRTTGHELYGKAFLAVYDRFRQNIRPAGPPSWANVGALGLWSYALAGRGDSAAAAAIRADSLKAADEIAARTAKHAYRHSMTTKDYIWGSNAVAANYGLQLLVANRMRPDRKDVNAALDNLHYLLGRNPFSLSWVTQVGANPYRHPHHRPSGADTNAEPWPGLLSGGPNGRKQDQAMNRMPDLAPAKMYIDDQESYASNEIAINWNAPLVFLLGGVISEAK